MPAKLQGAVWHRQRKDERMELQLDPNAWRKSRRSNAEGNCVELNDSDPAGIAVADSKQGYHVTIAFSRQAMATFIAGVPGMDSLAA